MEKVCEALPLWSTQPQRWNTAGEILRMPVGSTVPVLPMVLVLNAVRYGFGLGDCAIKQSSTEFI